MKMMTMTMVILTKSVMMCWLNSNVSVELVVLSLSRAIVPRVDGGAVR